MSEAFSYGEFVLCEDVFWKGSELCVCVIVYVSMCVLQLYVYVYVYECV